MMRLDEWLVQQSVFTSRSKAKRYIKEKGVKINGNLITKVAYQVKESDSITINSQIREKYNKPIGYRKLAFLISQANTTVNQSDICLDIGASVGGYSQYILEQNVKELVAIEYSKHFTTQLESIKSKNSNFTYIIGDFFKIHDDLPKRHFSLILMDLTIDPDFLLEKLNILEQLASYNKETTRIFLSVKLGKVQNKNELIQRFIDQIELVFPNLENILKLKPLPEKEEQVFFIKLRG